MSKEYVSGERESSRSYSKVVKTQGGTTLYLAGVGGSTDSDGNVLDFAGQTRMALARLDANLREAGGSMCYLLL